MFDALSKKTAPFSSVISPITLWLANFLDHFDVQLCMILSPLWIDLFFTSSADNAAKATAIHGLYFATSALAYPLGSVIFGLIADRISPVFALRCSILGFSLGTMGMGLLPSAYHYPLLAPLVFALFRFLQSFFARGERAITQIYLFSDDHKGDAINRATAFEFSVFLGGYLASLIGSSFLKKWPLATQLATQIDAWRIPFVGAGLVGCLLTWWRWAASKNPLPHNQASNDHGCNTGAGQSIISRPSWVWFAALACISGPWYLFYALIFKLDLFYPLISPLTALDLAQQTTYFFGIDLIAVLITRNIVKSIEEKTNVHFHHMRWVCLMGFIVLVPLFGIIPFWPSLKYIALLRISLIFMGVYYSMHFSLYLRDIIRFQSNPYLSIGMAKMVGTILLGHSCAYFSLKIYALTRWACAPGLYGTIVCVLALWGLNWFKKHGRTQGSRTTISPIA
jgi:MFS family permease